MNSPLLNYRNRVLNPANPINWEHPLNRGLVGCWMVPPNPGFRGAQTFWDLTRGSRGPNDGTLTNSPTWQPGGRPGGYGSLRMTESLGAFVSASGPACGGSDLSMFCWWQPIDTPTSQEPVFERATGVGDFTTLVSLRFNSSLKLYMLLRAGGTNAELLTSVTYSIGVWYYVGIVRFGNVVRLYVNSTQVGSDQTVTGSTNTTKPWFFGKTYDTTPRYLDMMCDDYRQYNRALSAGEVRALYNQSRRGHPDTMQWISSRAAFSAGAAPPTTPGVFNAAWWMVPNKNIGICRAV